MKCAFQAAKAWSGVPLTRFSRVTRMVGTKPLDSGGVSQAATMGGSARTGLKPGGTSRVKGGWFAGTAGAGVGAGVTGVAFATGVSFSLDWQARSATVVTRA